VNRQLGALDVYMTTAEVIRRIRKSIGMTQAELGALINFSQPAISGLERGGPASYDVRVLRLVARALQVPLAVLVVESDEEADVDRRNFFRAGALGGASAVVLGMGESRAAAPTGVRVDGCDVAAIGDRLCYLAAGQARYVQQLLDAGNYTEGVGRSLATAAAEMMIAAGWVHYDADRRDAARRYYADAAQTATAAGDGIAAAHALINASIIDLDTVEAVRYRTTTRQPRSQHAIHLTQAAQDSARRAGGPKVRAMAALREAQAQGVTDPIAMEKAVARAHRAYDSTRGYDPGWVWLPEAELNALTGISYMAAGMHQHAQTYLRSAVDAAAPWPRERTAWQLELALSYIEVGDPAQACSLLVDEFSSIRSVASTRLQRKLDALSTAVRRHAAVPEVKRFLGLRAEVT
jgi:hypothetical protein